MLKRVVVTGSVAFDHIMSMPGRFADHILPDKIHILNISFIMQTFEKDFGGTGGNIAYTLAKLGVPTMLAATAGRDFRDYKQHLKEVQNLTLRIRVYKNEMTANGFVVTDRDDNQIWGFYQGAMRHSANLNLGGILKSGDFLVIAPNDPGAMLTYADTARRSEVEYMFDPAFNIPHMNTRAMMKAIKYCRILIGNDYETGLICQRLNTDKKALAGNNRTVITTLGAKGSEITNQGKTIMIPAAKPKNVSDPTGAGDAYRAGFMAGLFRGLDPEICGRMGAVAAVYTVEKMGTQTHKLSWKDFGVRYRHNFGKLPT